MPSVGTAYVNIRINTKSFSTSLDAMMKRLSKQMEARAPHWARTSRRA